MHIESDPRPTRCACCLNGFSTRRQICAFVPECGHAVCNECWEDALDAVNGSRTSPDTQRIMKKCCGLALHVCFSKFPHKVVVPPRQGAVHLVDKDHLVPVFVAGRQKAVNEAHKVGALARRGSSRQQQTV